MKFIIGKIKQFNRINYHKLWKKLLEFFKISWSKLSIGLSGLPHLAQRLYYYIKIWIIMSKNSFMIVLTQKKLFIMFLTGKLMRFFFFFAFLYFLVEGSGSLAGYDTNQAIMFFLSFNIVDITAQFLFREVYRFRPLLVSGDFDLILSKPFSALYRVLLGGADIIDLVTIPALLYAVWYVGSQLDPSVLHTTYYMLLLFNGLMISAAFHIAVISLGIVTLEIDHSIMIYRDITNLGRFPVDIYKQPLRAVLTYLIPVGVMMSLPAKALLGLVSFTGVLLSFLLGIMVVFFSFRFWNFALRRYTSASS